MRRRLKLRLRLRRKLKVAEGDEAPEGQTEVAALAELRLS